MNPLERAAATSAWARVSPVEKAILFFGIALLAITLPAWPGLPLLIVVLLVAVHRARIPLPLYATMVVAPAGFILLGAIPLLIDVHWFSITLDRGNVAAAATLVARSITATAATMAFALSTPMAAVLSLMHSARIPGSIIFVTHSMYRMSGALVDTARLMWDAQARRLGHRSVRGWINAVGLQASSLFVIAFARARRLGEGLDLRGDLRDEVERGTRIAVAEPLRVRSLALTLTAFLVAIAVCVAVAPESQSWGW